MAPRIEDLSPIVGGDVYDEYGRVIGTLVSLSGTVEGEVEFIEVKIADRGLEKVEAGRIRLRDGKLVVTPVWKHSATRVINALDRAYRRRSALDQISAGEIPDVVLSQMRRKLEEEIKRLKVEAEKSIEGIKGRLQEIDDESLHVARAIALLQMQYFSGEVDDSSYQHGMSHLRRMKEALEREKEDAKRVMDKLVRTLRAATSHAKPVSRPAPAPAGAAQPAPARPPQPATAAVHAARPPARVPHEEVLSVKVED